MTENRRIILNILATYGRSLFVLACGIFTGRWTLMALGEVDYGLFGVVGGLAGFISFFNGLLAAAVARFFAYSLGVANKSQSKKFGLEECQRWFSIALAVHVVVPTFLMAIGYPLGIYTVEHWLTIPANRIPACDWVFRYTCITCYVGMVNVPYSAMYKAKQYIAELTVYTMITTALNVVFLYFMVTHPGDWLSRYAAWFCFVTVLPQIIINIQAVRKFKECKFVLAYCFDRRRLRELCSYAFWLFFGAVGGLVRGQGMAILINKYFGPAYNATMSVSNTVAGQTEALSSAMYGAFSPAITTYAGEGNAEKMLQFCYRSSKLGALLCLFFVLPLSSELSTVLTLWLKNPPPLLTGACALTLVYLVLGQLLNGIDLAFLAVGKVARFELYVGCFMIMTLPIAWIMIHFGVAGFLAVFWILVLFRILVCGITLPLAKKQLGYEWRTWVFKIVLPVVVVSAVSFGVGRFVKQCLMSYYWMRMFFVFTSVEIVFLPMSWFFVLNRQERDFIGGRVLSKVGKIFKGISHE